MSTNLVLLVVLVISNAAFLICQAAVPGMNLQDVIQSRNRHPEIHALTLRNLYAVLIMAIPVMLSLYFDYFFSSYRIPTTRNKAAILFATGLMVLAIRIGARSAYRFMNFWDQRMPDRLHAMPVYSYLLSRILFIISYELYFRGFIFWYCLQFMNLASAIAINIVLYMIAHYKCSQQIILGCIPMGLFLCLANYSANSVLPAILIHLALTISYECTLAWKATHYPKNYAL